MRRVLSLFPLLALLLAPPAAADEVALDLEQAFIGVAEKVSDSVAYLEVKARIADLSAEQRLAAPFLGNDPGGFDPLVEGAGSGVILDEQGHILTNYHVVRGAVEITVRLHDNRLLPGTVVGEDPDSDLAVVLVEADGLSPAEFAPSEGVAIGQWAIAIGAPFGLRYSMTVGHVSARSRREVGDLPIQDFLQTDASINPGNSGGPLVDVQGRVIGINTMIAGIGTGIGFAIPSDLAKRTAATLIAHGRVLRGDVGVELQDADSALCAHLGLPAGKTGALITRVDDAGPAAEMGLARGDVVVTFGGEDVADSRALQQAIFAATPGGEVKIAWYRDGKSMKGAVGIAERHGAPTGSQGPVEHTGDDIGVNVEGLTAEFNQRLGRAEDAPGLLVTQVRVGSPAQRAGLEFGDVIVEAAGSDLSYPIDLARAVIQAPGDAVLAYVYRPMTDVYRYLLVDKP
jgi:serine protease Do